MSPARRKGYVLKYRVPHAAVADSAGGPYGIAERIGRYSAGWRWPTAFGATVLVHFGLATLAYVGDREHRVIAAPPQQIITLERPPPPPPELEPPPPEPRPRPVRSPPPAAAQSGKVVAAAPAPEEPVDLTSFTMPVGTSESYAGGLTASTGTSTVAVTDPRANARGTVGGKGNQARPAGPARHDWSCPWPEEEQSSDLFDARVIVRVAVSQTGRAEQVDVLNSPKDSFAQAARACARSEPFRPARNEAGHEVAGLTPPFAVHFVR
jgi:protein TonB